MKKTVIKRRKRVPAAGGVTTGRMTDQAAAEALVAVGRLGGVLGEEESDGEVEQPRKKRARRGKSEAQKKREREEEEDAMEITEEEQERGRGARSSRSLRTRRRSRDSNGSGWDLGDNANDSIEHQRAPSLSRLVSGDYAHLQRSSSYGGFSASPHPHGGFDLPPLNAALGGSGNYGSILGGAPSSYIRSGSNAPSRTHSPLGPAGASTGTGYVLPPPHGMSHSHSGLYYNQTGLSPLHSRSPPPHQSHDPMNGTAPVPTYEDLKRHYDELMDQQKKIDEMSEKNQRMIAGVKRGLDEMQRGGSSSGNAMPLMRESERPRSRQSVWPLDTSQRE